MTYEQKFKAINRMLDEPEDPAVLEVYLNLAGQKILNRMYPLLSDYTGIKVPERFEMKQIEICVYLLNKRGAEGEIQHIEGGTHRNYGSADIPESMLKDIIPMAQAIRT